MASKIYIPIATSLALGLITGCVSTDIQSASGHYEGFRVSDGPSGPTQSSIGGELRLNGTQIDVSLDTEPPTGTPTTFAATVSGSTLTLSSPSGFLRKPLTLASGSDHCYSDKAGDQLCFDGSELRVLIVTSPGAIGATATSPGAVSAPGTAPFASASSTTPAQTTKFVVNRLDPQTGPAPTLAAPQTYTVDQLLALAQNRNFATQVEFDSVVQAKLNAQESYLNLLPHLNIGSGLDLIGFVTLTMVRAVGDLLPFLLPDRWFQAAAAEHQAAAQVDAYRIVQASGMNIVQGLAYSVLRDEQVLYTLQQNRVLVTDARDEVLYAEQAGTVQIGTSNPISSALVTLIAEIDALQDEIAQEKTALSQGSGFLNPHMVASVQPVDLPDMSGGFPGIESDYQTSALNRSVYLVQLDDMIEAAKDTKKGAFFQWLDPSGADSGSLGLGMIDSIKIDQSAIQQLMDTKTQSQSTLAQQVANAFTSSRELVNQYQLSVQAENLAQNEIDRDLLNFRTGIQFEMSDLVTSLQNRAQAQIGEINGQYAYLILQAQMDFLTYSGPYAALLSEPWPGGDKPPGPSTGTSPTPTP